MASRAKGKPVDMAGLQGVPGEIGYLVPEGPDFKVDTAKVDAEIASLAGRSWSCQS